MAFLDNSGDIILDAVLTDAGRERLARGTDEFKIVKFSLGDDEINYQNYNKNDPRGSAYYSLEILQTPIMEAMTNNAGTMKSKLISIPRTNLLYLPVIKLNQQIGVEKQSSSNAILVTSDKETTEGIANTNPYLNGFEMTSGPFMRLDQGLDTTAIPATRAIDQDLVETQYIVEIDNRLGQLYSDTGNRSSVSFVDEDSIASYFFSQDNVYVTENTATGENSDEVIRGPRGTILSLKIQAKQELQSSTYLFELLGSTFLIDGISHYFIDTTMRISGATTGYRVDIPIRFIKKV